MGNFLRTAAISAALLSLDAVGLQEARAESDPWSVDAPFEGGWAAAYGWGNDENSTLAIHCSHDRAGVGFTLGSFWGSALGRVNGERYPVLIVIRDRNGNRSEFYIGLRYDAPEKEWNTDGLDTPRSFLDAFAKGVAMRFEADEVIVAYGLKGSAAAARAMREACWPRSGS